MLATDRYTHPVDRRRTTKFKEGCRYRVRREVCRVLVEERGTAVEVEAPRRPKAVAP